MWGRFPLWRILREIARGGGIGYAVEMLSFTSVSSLSYRFLVSGNCLKRELEGPGEIRVVRFTIPKNVYLS